MKNKLLTLTFVGMFALIFLISFISSAKIISVPSEIERDSSSFTFNVTGSSSSTERVSLSMSNITEGTQTITFSLSPAFVDVTNTTSTKITVTYSTSSFDFKLGKTYTSTLTATSNNSENQTASIKFEVENDFCSASSNLGYLEIKDLELNVEEGFGEDDEFWYPLDEVEVVFTVKNKGSYDIEDIELTVCVYDSIEGECIFDEDDFDISEEKFDLDSKDDIEITMTMQIDPEELSGNEDYTIYLSATGTIEDSDSSDDGEDTCVSESQNIEIITSDEFIVLDDVSMNSPVGCGSTLEISGDIWNIGDSKIKDDEIFIQVRIPSLSITKTLEFDDDLKGLDSESFSLSIDIPETAKEGKYDLVIRVYDDDRMKDSDIYETSEGDEAEYNYYFEISGGSCSSGGSSTGLILVQTSLTSEKVIAGEEIKIKATITNSANSAQTIILSLEDYSSWANSAEATPLVITLNAGETKESVLALKIKEDAEGENFFNLKLMSATNELIKSHQVQIGIDEKISMFNLSGNWYLWVIGVLNVILVLIIIVVAIRVAKS